MEAASQALRYRGAAAGASAAHGALGTVLMRPGPRDSGPKLGAGRALLISPPPRALGRFPSTESAMPCPSHREIQIEEGTAWRAGQRTRPAIMGRPPEIGPHLPAQTHLPGPDRSRASLREQPHQGIMLENQEGRALDMPCRAPREV